MSQHISESISDKDFWAEKRKRQARCFEAIAKGERTQESALFFDPKTIRRANARLPIIFFESQLDQ
ncbi:hypothetical protein [Bordetella pseudohinzii]|uniref:hypothetical protein n=1 Tax=Bordetella pseudohinzii TaxID=1331258 RepID=UPI00045B7084|nr:hypothetical protein [Bordetella pseudohinzii]